MSRSVVFVTVTQYTTLPGGPDQDISTSPTSDFVSDIETTTSSPRLRSSHTRSSSKLPSSTVVSVSSSLIATTIPSSTLPASATIGIPPLPSGWPTPTQANATLPLTPPIADYSIPKLILAVIILLTILYLLFVLATILQWYRGRCENCSSIETKLRRLEEAHPEGGDPITKDMVRERMERENDIEREVKERLRRITREGRNATGEGLERRAWWRDALDGFVGYKGGKGEEKERGCDEKDGVEMNSRVVSFAGPSNNRESAYPDDLPVPPNFHRSALSLSSSVDTRDSVDSRPDVFHYDNHPLPPPRPVSPVPSSRYSHDESGDIANNRLGYRDSRTGSFVSYLPAYNGAPERTAQLPVASLPCTHSPASSTWAVAMDQHYKSDMAHIRYADERLAAGYTIDEPIPETYAPPLEIVDPSDPDVRRYRNAAGKATLMRDGEERDRARKEALDLLEGIKERGSVKRGTPEPRMYYDGFLTEIGVMQRPEWDRTVDKLPYVPPITARARAVRPQSLDVGRPEPQSAYPAVGHQDMRDQRYPPSIQRERAQSYPESSHRAPSQGSTIIRAVTVLPDPDSFDPNHMEENKEERKGLWAKGVKNMKGWMGKL